MTSSSSPMGANIQMVFYRRKGCEVLFKILLNRNFLPLLNEAGINMMIGADLHEAMDVNDDGIRLDFKASEGTIRINGFDHSLTQLASA